MWMINRVTKDKVGNGVIFLSHFHLGSKRLRRLQEASGEVAGAEVDLKDNVREKRAREVGNEVERNNNLGRLRRFTATTFQTWRKRRIYILCGMTASRRGSEAEEICKGGFCSSSFFSSSISMSFAYVPTDSANVEAMLWLKNLSLA